MCLCYMCVHVGATDKEIKDRFKQLALKWHPDKNPEDPKTAEEVLTECDHIIQCHRLCAWCFFVYRNFRSCRQRTVT